MASQALAGAHRRRVVSKDSLPLTGQAVLEPSGAGGAAREGESTSVWYQVGVGSGHLG